MKICNQCRRLYDDYDLKCVDDGSELVNYEDSRFYPGKRGAPDVVKSCPRCGRQYVRECMLCMHDAVPLIEARYQTAHHRDSAEGSSGYQSTQSHGEQNDNAQNEPKMKALYCRECGALLIPGATSCPMCGEEIDEAQEQETTDTGRKTGKGKKIIALSLIGAAAAVIVIGIALGRRRDYAPAAAPASEQIDDQELQPETEGSMDLTQAAETVESEDMNQAAGAENDHEDDTEVEISTGYVIITASDARLRADADPYTSVVGLADKDVIYPVVGTKTDETGNLWYCIEIPDGRKAYIRSDYAEYSVDIPTVEKAEIDWAQEIQIIAEQEREASSAMAEGKYRYDEGGLTILSAALMSLADLADQEEESVLENYRVAEAAEILLGEYVEGYKTYWSNLFNQDPGSGLYKELRMLADEGGALADRLDNSVLNNTDTAYLHECRSSLKDAYREKYILRFNLFTEGNTWSRSESWALMSDAHEAELINDSKLDDPLRLRYCYAMAMVNRKTNSNAVAEKKITKSEAIDNFLDVLEATDYNPTILYDCWKYADEIGDSRADEFYELYTDIIGRIRDTQDYKVDPEHFWYFNDFENYSVSPTNGVTVENRRWIRDYMQSRGY